jgi:hypothetical protein
MLFWPGETMTPTLTQIAHHDAHGGLWLVVPRKTEQGQPLPFFALLGIAKGPMGPFATYERGDMAATIQDAVFHGAEWVPVDSKGTRI